MKRKTIFLVFLTALMGCSATATPSATATADATTTSACTKLATAANEASNAAWSYDAMKIQMTDVSPPVNLRQDPVLDPVFLRDSRVLLAYGAAPEALKPEFHVAWKALPDISRVHDNDKKPFSMVVTADTVEWAKALDIALKDCVRKGVPLQRWDTSVAKLVPVAG